MKPFVIIITGPTASGKTGLSYELANYYPCEVINADMGQFYTPLTIGTAKPDWVNGSCPAHLFDIINEPIEMTVVAYREMVLHKVQEITVRGNIPVIVGGSLFYIKSLFYPPKQFLLDTKKEDFFTEIKKDDAWNLLHIIDPVRAAHIHRNDVYRINRALDIWQQTGTIPSLQRPEIDCLFDTLFVAITPPIDILRSRILLRLHEMIYCDGWLDEVARLDSGWISFLKKKKIIGYQLVIDYLDKIILEKQDLIEKITISTNQYAKRQLTFLKKLIKDLLAEASAGKANITVLTNDDYQLCLKDILGLLEKKRVSDKLQYGKHR